MTGLITVNLDSFDPDRDSAEVIETKAINLANNLPILAEQINASTQAMNFNATNSTSSTSWTIAASGTQTFSIETEKSYVPGMTVKVAATSNPIKWALGDVISASSGSIEVTFRQMSTGGGTFSDWTISQNASNVDLQSEIKFRSSSNTIYAANHSQFFDCVANTQTQSFDSAATLGDGFWVDVRNSGTGVVTLDPSGSQTISGSSTLKLYNGETYRIFCDGTSLYAMLISRAIGDQEIIAHTGNGYASTNTKRRRYTTKVKDTATNIITYADSATLGATFTVLVPGDYLITRQEKYDTTSGRGGIALNPSSGTANYSSLAYAERLGGLMNASTVLYGSVTVMRRLAANDVVVAHDDSTLFGGVTDESFFSIKRMN